MLLDCSFDVFANSWALDPHPKWILHHAFRWASGPHEIEFAIDDDLDLGDALWCAKEEEIVVKALRRWEHHIDCVRKEILRDRQFNIKGCVGEIDGHFQTLLPRKCVCNWEEAPRYITWAWRSAPALVHSAHWRQRFRRHWVNIWAKQTAWIFCEAFFSVAPISIGYAGFSDAI